MSSIQENTAPVGWRSRVGFGVGGFGVSLVYASVGYFLLYFYTNVFGLSAGQAGTILFIGALADAFIDPFVGWIASRTRTRWGRYRPFLLFGAAPMSLLFILNFVNPGFTGARLFWYALTTLVFFRAAFQLIYMPYTSMIVVLSKDADERSEIEGWRAWFIAAGSLCVTFLGLEFVNYFGAGDDAQGFLTVSIIVGALSTAAFLFTAITTREVDAENAKDDESNPLAVAKLMIKNDQMLIVIAAMIISQTAYAMILSGSAIYFENALGARELTRWPLAASTSAGLVASMIWPMVCRRTSRRFTWICGVMLSSVGLTALYVAAPTTIAPYVIGFLIIGAGVQCSIIMQFSAAADALDYGEWKTGKRTEAIGFAIITFGMKVSLAIGNGLVGWLYEIFGYAPNTVADPTILSGLRFTLLAIPAALYGVSALIIHMYSITSKRHGDMIKDIAVRAKNLT